MSRQLYKCAIVKILSVTFEYFTVEDCRKETVMDAQREIQESSDTSGYTKIHCFIPDSKNQGQTKVFSEADEFNIKHIVHFKHEEYRVEDIRGFIYCKYGREWWVACVLQMNDNEIHLMFLHPSDPSKSFMCPSSPDIVSVPPSEMLKSRSRDCSRSRTYVVSERNPVALLRN
jgi:hypothetical protein